MKNTKEIVLFFEENTKFTPLDVAKEIVKRYPELDNPLVLSEQENQNPNIPLVLFKENPSFQLKTNYANVSFLIDHTKFDDIITIIFDIVDAFEGFKVRVNRIGYVSNIFLSPKVLTEVQDKYLKMNEIGEIGNMNLSWYRKLNNKYGNINCWERIITDKDNFEDVLFQYDINTPNGEWVSLDMKFIKEFINTANDFIDERTDF